MTTNYCWASKTGRVAIGTHKFIGLGISWKDQSYLMGKSPLLISLRLPFVVIDMQVGKRLD